MFEDWLQLDDSAAELALVTPEEAQLVNLASELGTIQLMMRGPEEDAKEGDDIAPASIDVLLGRSKNADLEAEDPQSEDEDMLTLLSNAAQREPSPSPSSDPTVEQPSVRRIESWKMRIMSGNESENIVLKMEKKSATQGTGFEFWQLGN